MAASLPPSGHSKLPLPVSPVLGFKPDDKKLLESVEPKPLERRLSKASVMTFQHPPADPPKSLLERTWQQIRSFFSETHTKMRNVFAFIFGKPSQENRVVPIESHKDSSVINTSNEYERFLKVNPDFELNLKSFIEGKGVDSNFLVELDQRLDSLKVVGDERDALKLLEAIDGIEKAVRGIELHKALFSTSQGPVARTQLETLSGLHAILTVLNQKVEAIVKNNQESLSLICTPSQADTAPETEFKVRIRSLVQETPVGPNPFIKPLPPVDRLELNDQFFEKINQFKQSLNEITFNNTAADEEVAEGFLSLIDEIGMFKKKLENEIFNSVSSATSDHLIGILGRLNEFDDLIENIVQENHDNLENVRLYVDEEVGVKIASLIDVYGEVFYEFPDEIETPEFRGIDIEGIPIPPRLIKEGVQPNGIPNTGNSCYRNSVNQALRIFQPLRSLFEGVGPKIEPQYQPVRAALSTLFQCLEDNATSQDIANAERKFCGTLFSLGLQEFNPRSVRHGMTGQHDAAAYLEVILSRILGHQFQVVDEHSAKDVDGRIVTKQVSPQPKAFVRIPIGQGDFQKMTDAYFSDSDAEEWKTDNPAFDAKHNSRPVITSNPQDVLVLQLGRDSFDATTTVHDHTKVRFPEDGILDFSKAHGLTTGSLKYQMKSFVHLSSGSKDSGHYISYVEKEGRWFCCNDSIVTPVSKQQAAQAMAESYIFFFEKLPTKKVVVPGA